MQEFEFNVRYKKGEKMVDVDEISRWGTEIEKN